MYNVSQNSPIYNFLLVTCATSQFSKPVVSHLQSFMTTVKGFSGKIIILKMFGSKHRNTFSRFLSKGKWDESRIEYTIKKTVGMKYRKSPIQYSFICTDTSLTVQKILKYYGSEGNRNILSAEDELGIIEISKIFTKWNREISSL